MAKVNPPSHYLKKTGSSGRMHVILNAEGSLLYEWNDVADSIGQYDRVLQYERYGYGESIIYNLERTPENIVVELGMILNRTKIGKGAVLIGNSIGAYYASIFALKFPEIVQGLILIDPIFPMYREFIEEVGEKTSKKSKVDPVEFFNRNFGKSILGFLKINKLPLLNHPPFSLYDFKKEDNKNLLKFMGRKQTYVTGIDEFEEMLKSNEDLLINGIKNHELGDKPLVLITHNPQLRKEDLVKTYGLNEDEANNLEDLQLKGMKKYLQLSKSPFIITSKAKTRYVHLEDPESIIKAVDKLHEILGDELE